MVFDATSGARLVHGMDKLKAFDADISRIRKRVF